MKILYYLLLAITGLYGGMCLAAYNTNRHPGTLLAGLLLLAGFGTGIWLSAWWPPLVAFLIAPFVWRPSGSRT